MGRVTFWGRDGWTVCTLFLMINFTPNFMVNCSCSLKIQKYKNTCIFFLSQFLNYPLRVFKFTFMHLADTLIQRNTHCVKCIHFYKFKNVNIAGNRTHDFCVASTMLYCLSFRNAHKNETKTIKNN